MRITSHWIDKREHNRALKDVLEKELPLRDLKLGDRTRLMILDSEDGDTKFVKMVESLEAKFVIEDHCSEPAISGTRSSRPRTGWPPSPPATKTARPVTTKDRSQRKRLDHVLKLAQDWKVRGAIILRRKCCDPQEPDVPALRQALEGIGVPSLFLEADGHRPRKPV